MADVDLDMDSRYRDEMIAYAAKKYGDLNVAQIITFGQIKARSAVKSAARVLGKPYTLGSDLVDKMPPVVMGRDTPLKACLELTPKFEDGYVQAQGLRDTYKFDSDAREVIDTALTLEGLINQDSIHAAAVVISDLPLYNYCPVQRKPDGPLVTQFEMHNIEELGLLKMDFLGVRNYDTIEIATELIRRKVSNFDLDKIPDGDVATYKMLCAGDTKGVFQLESPKMTELVVRLQPDNLNDIAALVALYRPGPMGTGMHLEYADRKNERVIYNVFHPDAEELLESTYGIIVYQEDMMRIAQKFAGYSLAEADSLRKATGKKIRELMAAEKEKFRAGVLSQGYEESIADFLWETIEPFADYSFNKSHAFSYGYLSYVTAYLKANHPLEYMAALMTSNPTKVNKINKLAGFLIESSKMGLTILQPDVNKSEFGFTIEGDAIRFGLKGMSDMGESVLEKLFEARQERLFSSFQDFAERALEAGVGESKVVQLIRGGACDSFGHTRRGMEETVPNIKKIVKRKQKDLNRGAFALFQDDEVAISDKEFSNKIQMKNEKDALGVYLTNHPLSDYVSMYDEPGVTKLEDIDQSIGKVVSVVGRLYDIVRKTSRKGNDLGYAQFEDLTSYVEVIIFSSTLKRFGHLLQEDAIVELEVKVESRDEYQSYIVNKIIPLEV